VLTEQGGSLEGGLEVPPTNEAESPLEATRLGLSAAIVRYRDAAARLSQIEHRETAMRLLAQDAAELAVVHDLIDEPPAPEPFVTGNQEPPLVAPGPLEENGE
jgi:hypothetical protein